MLRFIHAADLHLDSPLHGLAREGESTARLRGATRRAFENLVDLALEEQVAFVLLAGDLFDGDWKDYNSGLFLVRQLSRLRHADIPVVMVRGNHDAESRITRSVQLPANVHLLGSRRAETVRLDRLRVAIHGQSYPRPDVTTDLVPHYPEAEPGWFNIGLLHTALNGREGHMPYAPTSLASLAARAYDYWALGHVHAFEVVAQDPWVVFPGNIQGRHVRETGEKGCVLVSVEEGKVCAVDHRALDVVRWFRERVDVTGAVRPDEVLERAGRTAAAALSRADGRPIALRIELTGACAAHGALATERARWESELLALVADQFGDEVFLERIVFSTSLPRETAAEGDFEELLRGIDEPELALAALEEVRGDLEELRGRIGRTRADVPLPDLSDPQTAAALLEDARQLLMARLLAGGGES